MFLKMKCLTVSSQILLQKLLKVLGSVQLEVDVAEVEVRDNVVLWVSRHIDNLAKTLQ